MVLSNFENLLLSRAVLLGWKIFFLAAMSSKLTNLFNRAGVGLCLKSRIICLTCFLTRRLNLVLFLSCLSFFNAELVIGICCSILGID